MKYLFITIPLLFSSYTFAKDQCEELSNRFLELNGINLNDKNVQKEISQRKQIIEIEDAHNEKNKSTEDLRVLLENQIYAKYIENPSSATREEEELTFLILQAHLNKNNPSYNPRYTIENITSATRVNIQQQIKSYIGDIKSSKNYTAKNYPFRDSLPNSLLVIKDKENMNTITFYKRTSPPRHSFSFDGVAIEIEKDSNDNILNTTISGYKDDSVYQGMTVSFERADGKCFIKPGEGVTSEFFSDENARFKDLSNDKCNNLLNLSKDNASPDQLKRLILNDLDLLRNWELSKYTEFKSSQIAPYIEFCEKFGNDLLSSQKLKELRIKEEFAEQTKGCEELQNKTKVSESDISPILKK